MMRGTFANIRIKNEMLGGEEGGNTIYIPTGEKLAIYDAAMRYQKIKRHWSLLQVKNTVQAHHVTGRQKEPIFWV
jgi:aconitase A